MSEFQRDQILAVIETLALAFPKAFFVYQVRRKPLKIGIFQDLVAQVDGAITRKELGAALRHYCGGPGYLRNMAKDAWRLDLDGKRAGIRYRRRGHGSQGTVGAYSGAAAGQRSP